MKVKYFHDFFQTGLFCKVFPTVQMFNKHSTLGNAGNMQQVASLRQTLNQVMQQNSLLRGKLQKIQIESQVEDLPQVGFL